jgi:predicted TIM-barrel fold metal-dependent hydrolase
MRTPWGNLAVADAHVHFFSFRFFSILARQKGLAGDVASVAQAGSQLGWEMPPSEPDRFAERWVRELDRHGVDRSVLIASIPGDEDSVGVAVACFPHRFYGYFLLNPCAPDARAVASSAIGRGLRGICLYPAMHHFSMQDERVFPLLDLAASRPGAIVFVHCGVLSVGVRKRLGLPSPFDLRFSNPIEVQAVAQRYPQVPFVIPHFGAGYFREALMVADLCPNVYLDTSSSNSWIRYLEPGWDLKAVFRRSLDVIGPSRLLFGTDSSWFPRGWNREIFESQTALLEEIGIDAAAAGALLGGNLRRLLG